jgi:hypothetical protein
VRSEIAVLDPHSILLFSAILHLLTQLVDLGALIGGEIERQPVDPVAQAVEAFRVELRHPQGLAQSRTCVVIPGPPDAQ